MNRPLSTKNARRIRRGISVFHLEEQLKRQMNGATPLTSAALVNSIVKITPRPVDDELAYRAYSRLANRRADELYNQAQERMRKLFDQYDNEPSDLVED